MKKGFTLVELSIVLVIIGILAAGIIKGTELIKVAQIHRLHIEYDDLKKSYATFRLKYNCLPGDCNKAAAYMGNGMRDGNGDGEITPMVIGGETIYENLLAFEQMGRAGFYKRYSGNDTSCYVDPDDSDINKLFNKCGYPQPGRSAPLFMFKYDDTSFFNVLPKGKETFACINTTMGCLNADEKSNLTSEDVRSFDTIFDDGKPFTGTVLSACTAGTNSFTDYDGSDAEGDYDITLKSCPIIVKF